MPRKSKAKKTEAIADTLETLKKEIPALTTAAELSNPRSDAEPPPRELIVSDSDHDRHVPSQHRNGEDRGLDQAPNELGEHTAAVLARRPAFLPVPSGYKNAARFETAGIRVNRGVERDTLGKAALQFAEDRTLSRATEYDLMTQVQQAGFQYQVGTRQWERPLPEGMPPGQNTIDAVNLAKEIANARDQGRGR